MVSIILYFVRNIRIKSYLTRRSGNWPRSGEIDLVEIHGNDVYICKDLITDNRRAKSTLHWGNSTSQDKYEKTGWIK
jgi:hypothetical protein